MQTASDRFAHGGHFKRHMIRDDKQLAFQHFAVLRETTVIVHPGSCHRVAKMRLAVSAMIACPAGDVGVDRHALPRLNTRHLTSNLFNDTAELVPQDDRGIAVCGALRAGKNMQVSAADTAGHDFDENLPGAYLRGGEAAFDPDVAFAIINRCFHASSSSIILIKARPILGSNCVPRLRRISSSAALTLMAVL